MKPIASAWIIGITGKRIGTEYFHTEEEIKKNRHKKGFRLLGRGKGKRGE